MFGMYSIRLIVHMQRQFSEGRVLCLVNSMLEIMKRNRKHFTHCIFVYFNRRHTRIHGTAHIAHEKISRFKCMGHSMSLIQSKLYTLYNQAHLDPIKMCQISSKTKRPLQLQTSMANEYFNLYSPQPPKCSPLISPKPVRFALHMPFASLLWPTPARYCQR